MVTRRRPHSAAATTPPSSCRPSHLTFKVPFPGLVSANELREPHRLPHNPEWRASSVFNMSLQMLPSFTIVDVTLRSRESAKIQTKKWSLPGYDHARMQRPLLKGPH
ncbi:hypothetical protein LZ30DRAFT_119987 [Colletotrichum cereale]|nr:hypothetical protein LZ30DRAFT_119987 [Colletotrichum cereale]